MIPIIPGFPGFVADDGSTSAFPVLRSTSNDISSTLGTSHTIDLPSGVQAGDLLVLIYTARSDSTGQTTPPVPTDWTSLALYDAASTFKTRVLYRIASGAHTTVTITTPGQNTGLTSNCYCFSSFSEVPVVSGGTTLASTSSPNPPSLTVPGGWGVSPHCLFLSVVHSNGNNTVSSNSTNYSNRVSSSNSNNNRTWSARRELQATSDDPGSWSLSSSTGTVATTIAIRGT